MGEQQNGPAVATAVGASGASHRFGRAVSLRRLGGRAKREQQEALGHDGPFVPVVLQACLEQQLAYEYRHGVTSYGAFTYALTQILRTRRKGGRPVGYRELVQQVRERIRTLFRFDQDPCVFGPTRKLDEPVRWQAKGSPGVKTG